MKKRWGKGEPVNLSDLLKITPVANEIMHLTEELDMSATDVMCIVAQIIDNGKEFDSEAFEKVFNENDNSLSYDLDDIDLDIENVEDEMEQATYMVNVKINSPGRFPEVGFKAGMNDKEDINYFFDMILDVMEKLE